MEGTVIAINNPSSVVSGTTVEIEVSFYGMNGCSTPFDIKAEQVGQKIVLRGYYEQPTDGRICNESLPTHKLKYSFFTDIRGVYFFESNSATVSSTLTVY